MVGFRSWGVGIGDLG